MTKAEMKRMTVTARDRFTLDGCEYRPGIGGRYEEDSPTLKCKGFSARGTWTAFTNGSNSVTVYKRDLLAVDENKAFLLFNGYKA